MSRTRRQTTSLNSGESFFRAGLGGNRVGSRSRGRPRPILMTTSSVAILGLLPASIARGLGSDVQRPLATVIVWGLVSAVLLALFVVPVMYRIFAPKVHPVK